MKRTSRTKHEKTSKTKITQLWSKKTPFPFPAPGLALWPSPNAPFPSTPSLAASSSVHSFPFFRCFGHQKESNMIKFPTNAFHADSYSTSNDCWRRCTFCCHCCLLFNPYNSWARFNDLCFRGLRGWDQQFMRTSKSIPWNPHMDGTSIMWKKQLPFTLKTVLWSMLLSLLAIPTRRCGWNCFYVWDLDKIWPKQCISGCLAANNSKEWPDFRGWKERKPEASRNVWGPC